MSVHRPNDIRLHDRRIKAALFPRRRVGDSRRDPRQRGCFRSLSQQQDHDLILRIVSTPNVMSIGPLLTTASPRFCHTQFYALGLLTYQDGDPMDMANWVKTGPLFQSANGQFGTGHNSFFTSPDGTETWNTYHFTTNPQGSCGGDRQVASKVMEWFPDDSPNFGVPPPLGEVLPGPSGEA